MEVLLRDRFFPVLLQLGNPRVQIPDLGQDFIWQPGQVSESSVSPGIRGCAICFLPDNIKNLLTNIVQVYVHVPEDLGGQTVFFT